MQEKRFTPPPPMRKADYHVSDSELFERFARDMKSKEEQRATQMVISAMLRSK